jgi:O-antigen/teichoic acid export membrane protein
LPFQNESVKRITSRIAVASISPFFTFATRFLRTVLISRFLTPADYGVVVAIVTIYLFFEMAADVGLDRFVAITSGPQRAQAVAAARQIFFARALLLAIIIVVLAPQLADLFSAGDRLESVRWLAGLPLIWVCANLRVKQVQQEYRNGPEAWCTCSAQVAALLAAAAALHFFRDERVMLISLYVEAIVYVAVSWLVIGHERVQRVDPAMRRAALRFGLPLMLNGIGLVLLSQMDRLMVSSLFGLEVLALYSLVVNLALVPLAPMLTVLGRLTLAYLVPRLQNGNAFRQASSTVTWLVMLLAAFYAVGVAMFLDFAVPAIYGPYYRVSPGMHGIVCFLAFLRFSRQGPSQILLVSSRTRPLALANVVAGTGLALAYLFGLTTHDLDWVLAGLAMSDTASWAYFFWVVRKSVPLNLFLRRLAVPLVAVIATATVVMLEPSGGLMVRIVTGLLATAALAFEGLRAFRLLHQPPQ